MNMILEVAGASSTTTMFRSVAIFAALTMLVPPGTCMYCIIVSAPDVSKVRSLPVQVLSSTGDSTHHAKCKCCSGRKHQAVESGNHQARSIVPLEADCPLPHEPMPCCDSICKVSGEKWSSSRSDLPSNSDLICQLTLRPLAFTPHRFETTTTPPPTGRPICVLFCSLQV